jgi:hypothetical protein
MCEIRFRLTGYWEIDINWDLYPRAIREGCTQVGKDMNMPATAVLCGLLILTVDETSFEKMGAVMADNHENFLEYMTN